jgi:hypothetical protein
MFEEKLELIGAALMKCSDEFFDIGFPVTYRKGQYVICGDKKISFEDSIGNYFFIESAKGNRIKHTLYNNPKQIFAEKNFTLYAVAVPRDGVLVSTENMYQCLMLCLNAFGFLAISAGYDDTENAVSDFIKTIKDENKSTVLSKLMELSIIRIDFSIITSIGNSCDCKIC